MSAAPTRTSIADLIRVARHLHADAATLRAAAVQLGLATTPVTAEPVPAPPRSNPPTPAPATTTPRRRPLPDQETPIRPAGRDPRPARTARLIPSGSIVPTPPRPVRGSVTDLLPPRPAPAPSVEPLFDPQRQRAVLSTVATTRPPGREIAVPELVETVARREPVTRLPMRPVPTTRLGVCVLVDDGPAMAPFRQDVWSLVDSLRQVGGRDSVAAFAFHDRLDLVTSLSEPDGERPWTPVAGPRLLVATDLGVGLPGSPIRPADWQDFATAARAAGSPLLVLCPYPPARWPRWSTAMAIVQWDRTTSARDVQRALRSRR